MKNRHRKYISALAAISLLLPLGAFAQAGSSGTTGTTGTGKSSQYPGSTATQQSGSTSSQYPSTTPSTSSQQPGSSSQYPSSTSQRQGSQYPGSTTQGSTTGEYSGTSTSAQGYMASQGQFRRIKEDKLKEQKMTAENLVGKKIVDRDGQTIGEIKDIGLGSILQDSSTQQYGQTAGATSTTGTTSAIGTTSATGTTGTTSTGGTTGSTSTSDLAGTTGTTRSPGTTDTSATGAGAMTGRASTASSMSAQSGQIELYVELDKSVGIQGDDLAVIPASRVSFDRQKEQLKLNIARSEFASQLKQSSTGQSSSRN